MRGWKMNKLFTQKELSEYLQVSIMTLWKWRKKGMPYVKAGKNVRYDKEQVMKWLEENKK